MSPAVFEDRLADLHKPTILIQKIPPVLDPAVKSIATEPTGYGGEAKEITDCDDPDDRKIPPTG
jgi:hypothetical protein